MCRAPLQCAVRWVFVLCHVLCALYRDCIVALCVVPFASCVVSRMKQHFMSRLYRSRQPRPSPLPYPPPRMQPACIMLRAFASTQSHKLMAAPPRSHHDDRVGSHPEGRHGSRLHRSRSPVGGWGHGHQHVGQQATDGHQAHKHNGAHGPGDGERLDNVGGQQPTPSLRANVLRHRNPCGSGREQSWGGRREGR